MSKKLFRSAPLALAFFSALILLLGGAAFADEPKPLPLQTQKCARCHSDFASEEGVLTGEFQSLSNKAKSMQVQVNDTMMIVKFTDDTDVDNVKELKDLKKPIPVKVYYDKKGDDLIATHVVAKPVIKVPPEQLVSVEEMQKLVAEGPEKGDYVLVDSRPGAAYTEGHIPGAVSIPFPKLLDLAEKKLPKDKNKRIIFYCGGFR